MRIQKRTAGIRFTLLDYDESVLDGPLSSPTRDLLLVCKVVRASLTLAQRSISFGQVPSGLPTTVKNMQLTNMSPVPLVYAVTTEQLSWASAAIQVSNSERFGVVMPHDPQTIPFAFSPLLPGKLKVSLRIRNILDPAHDAVVDVKALVVKRRTFFLSTLRLSLPAPAPRDGSSVHAFFTVTNVSQRARTLVVRQTTHQDTHTILFAADPAQRLQAVSDEGTKKAKKKKAKASAQPPSASEHSAAAQAAAAAAAATVAEVVRTASVLSRSFAEGLPPEGGEDGVPAVPPRTETPPAEPPTEAMVERVVELHEKIASKLKKGHKDKAAILQRELDEVSERLTSLGVDVPSADGGGEEEEEEEPTIDTSDWQVSATVVEFSLAPGTSQRFAVSTRTDSSVELGPFEVECEVCDARNVDSRCTWRLLGEVSDDAEGVVVTAGGTAVGGGGASASQSPASSVDDRQTVSPQASPTLGRTGADGGGGVRGSSHDGGNSGRGGAGDGADESVLLLDRASVRAALQLGRAGAPSPPVVPKANRIEILVARRLTDPLEVLADTEEVVDVGQIHGSFNASGVFVAPAPVVVRILVRNRGPHPVTSCLVYTNLRNEVHLYADRLCTVPSTAEPIAVGEEKMVFAVVAPVIDAESMLGEYGTGTRGRTLRGALHVSCRYADGVAPSLRRCLPLRAVAGETRVTVNPTSIHFGSTTIGDLASQTFSDFVAISNESANMWCDVNISRPTAAVVQPSSFRLAPRETRDVHVTVEPSGPGFFGERLCVTTSGVDGTHSTIVTSLFVSPGFVSTDLPSMTVGGMDVVRFGNLLVAPESSLASRASEDASMGGADDGSGSGGGSRVGEADGDRSVAVSRLALIPTKSDSLASTVMSFRCRNIAGFAMELLPMSNLDVVVQWESVAPLSAAELDMRAANRRLGTKAFHVVGTAKHLRPTEEVWVHVYPAEPTNLRRAKVARIMQGRKAHFRGQVSLVLQPTPTVPVPLTVAAALLRGAFVASLGSLVPAMLDLGTVGVGNDWSQVLGRVTIVNESHVAPLRVRLSPDSLPGYVHIMGSQTRWELAPRSKKALTLSVSPSGLATERVEASLAANAEALSSDTADVGSWTSSKVTRKGRAVTGARALLSSLPSGDALRSVRHSSARVTHRSSSSVLSRLSAALSREGTESSGGGERYEEEESGSSSASTSDGDDDVTHGNEHSSVSIVPFAFDLVLENELNPQNVMRSTFSGQLTIPKLQFAGLSKPRQIDVGGNVVVPAEALAAVAPHLLSALAPRVVWFTLVSSARTALRVTLTVKPSFHGIESQVEAEIVSRDSFTQVTDLWLEPRASLELGLRLRALPSARRPFSSLLAATLFMVEARAADGFQVKAQVCASILPGPTFFVTTASGSMVSRPPGRLESAASDETTGGGSGEAGGQLATPSAALVLVTTSTLELLLVNPSTRGPLQVRVRLTAASPPAFQQFLALLTPNVVSVEAEGRARCRIAVQRPEEAASVLADHGEARVTLELADVASDYVETLGVSVVAGVAGSMSASHGHMDMASRDNSLSASGRTARTDESGGDLDEGVGVGGGPATAAAAAVLRASDVDDLFSSSSGGDGGGGGAGSSRQGTDEGTGSTSTVETGDAAPATLAVRDADRVSAHMYQVDCGRIDLASNTLSVPLKLCVTGGADPRSACLWYEIDESSLVDLVSLSPAKGMVPPVHGRVVTVAVPTGRLGVLCAYARLRWWRKEDHTGAPDGTLVVKVLASVVAPCDSASRLFAVRVPRTSVSSDDTYDLGCITANQLARRGRYFEVQNLCDTALHFRLRYQLHAGWRPHMHGGSEVHFSLARSSETLVSFLRVDAHTTRRVFLLVHPVVEGSYMADGAARAADERTPKEIHVTVSCRQVRESVRTLVLRCSLRWPTIRLSQTRVQFLSLSRANLARNTFADAAQAERHLLNVSTTGVSSEVRFRLWSLSHFFSVSPVVGELSGSSPSRLICVSLNLEAIREYAEALARELYISEYVTVYNADNLFESHAIELRLALGVLPGFTGYPASVYPFPLLSVEAAIASLVAEPPDVNEVSFQLHALTTELARLGRQRHARRAGVLPLATVLFTFGVERGIPDVQVLLRTFRAAAETVASAGSVSDQAYLRQLQILQADE
jgi:hypothetical protein